MFSCVATTERVKITLPPGFDPGRHVKALAKKIADHYGDGFEIDSIDPAENVAYASRQAAVTEVTATVLKPDSFEVRLVRGTKPADGDRVAIRMADQYPGLVMTRFEPFLGKAVLSKLDPATARCRGAVAIALGVKPWDVQVLPRSDGGFDLELPPGYVASKHDVKLDEVATSVVGRVGWYVDVDVAALTASIIPSTPPTFPAAFTYPVKTPVPEFSLASTDWAKIPLGHVLPEPGTEVGPVFSIDLLAGAHLQIGGTSGSGKSIVINNFIAGCLSRGAELVVVDLPSKSVDFLWCKKFCRDGGWGCDSLPAAVTALALVMEEGERRAKVLARHHVIKWTDLPPDSDVRPIVVIVDELTGLFYPEKVPKLAKDHPLVIEANEINLQKAILEKFIRRIAAELRFVGVHLLLSSQVASVATGIDPALRTNLHHKILMGSKPTDNNRRLVLSDPGRVPKVPGNVAADPMASRGTGSAEPEGREPCVFKSFYSDTAGLDAWLVARGVATTHRPAPTTAEIAQYTPSLDDNDAAGTPRDEGGYDPGPKLDPRTGEVMTGYARANDARRQLDESAGTARARPVEMAQAGPVTVTHREPAGTPED